MSGLLPEAGLADELHVSGAGDIPSPADPHSERLAPSRLSKRAMALDVGHPFHHAASASERQSVALGEPHGLCLSWRVGLA